MSLAVFRKLRSVACFLFPFSVPLLRIAVVLFALFFIGAYLFITYHTLYYPYQMEWLEGAIMDSVARVYHGKPIFVPPSIEHIPLMYTQFYYYVAALFSFVMGLDFPAARMVSFLATIGTCTVVFLWLRKEGARWWLSLIGSGLFLATYELSNNWFNLAREDSLFVCLTMLGLYLLYFFESRRSAIASALVLLAAVYTKQPAGIILACVFAVEIFIRPRRTFMVGLILGVLGLTIGGMLEILTDGWYLVYVEQIPRTTPKRWDYIHKFWPDDVYSHFEQGYMLIIVAAWMLFGREPKTLLRYAALFCGVMIAACISRVHVGGWPNVLMPAHAALAVMIMLAVHKLSLDSNTWKKVVIYLLLLLQFHQLYFDPEKKIPTEQHYQAGKTYYDKLASLSGEVFIADMQFIQLRYGQPSYAWRTMGSDITQAKLRPEKESMKNILHEVRGEVVSGRFSALILTSIRYPGIDNRYFYAGQMLAKGESFLLTGSYYIPIQLYLLR